MDVTIILTKKFSAYEKNLTYFNYARGLHTIPITCGRYLEFKKDTIKSIFKNTQAVIKLFSCQEKFNGTNILAQQLLN